MRCLMSAGIVSLLAGAAVAAGGGNSGLVVLSPGAQGALEMVGNSRVEIPAKIVYVNSSHQQAVDTTGSAVLDAPAMYLVGGARFNGQSQFTGTLHKRVARPSPTRLRTCSSHATTRWRTSGAGASTATAP